MATDIKCPACGHVFPMEQAVSEEYKRDLRDQMMKYKRQKDLEVMKQREELSKKESEVLLQLQRKQDEYEHRLATERLKVQQATEESLRKSIGTEFENKVRVLEQANNENEEKLRIARQKEFEFLQKENDLKTREAELELSVQRKLQEERIRISEDIRKIEEQKVHARETEYQLRLKELEKQLDDQKKLAEEMRRKADQGSMQLQGEVQEIALEEMLKAAFPFDVVCEVGKGMRGADCMLTIRNNFGQECGKIIFESKRTKDFGQDWIEKIKTDMRSQGADLAVIVTQAMPRDMQRFGEKDGVWICTFAEAKALVHVLRDGVIKIFNSSKMHANRGEKVDMLYDYLISNEFAEQWKAIREGFLSMKLSIQRERDAMERLWKARERQLEKVLLNAAHIRGSIEGIAGQDTIDLNLIEDMNGLEEEE